MEKLLPEELADRVGRLERECLDLRRANRHMKQFGGLTAVVAILMTMGGAQLAQRTEEVRAGSILLVDKGGFPRRSLPSLLTRTTEQSCNSATRVRGTRRSSLQSTGKTRSP